MAERIKDKVSLLIEETGCDRSEAELALELCGYDLESAVKAVPRLFQNIAVLKARVRAVDEALYGLLLVILNLKERALLRARAVVSHNPAVFATDIEQHWFDFEARLYACRLWVGTVQELSQDVEQVLCAYFASEEARSFYQERTGGVGGKGLEALKTALSAKLGSTVDLGVHQDVLDMGQFQEVRPRPGESEPGKPGKRTSRGQSGPGLGPGGMLVLAVDFEKDAQGVPAKQLCAGDLVYTTISDARDIAQYLSKLFGSRSEEGVSPLPVPIEAIEKDAQGGVAIRVRFSAGVCGDLVVDGEERLRAVPRPSNLPWWKKIFGRA